MGLFSTEEDRARKEAERRAREAAEAAQRQAQTEEASRRGWAASPLGRATAARDVGHTFFEMQLELGRAEGRAGWGTRDYESSEQITSAAELLGEIERVGWRLEHVACAFRMTGLSSTERFMTSGEETAVSGVTVGLYVFRSTASPASTDTTAGPALGADDPADVGQTGGPAWG